MPTTLLLLYNEQMCSPLLCSRMQKFTSMSRDDLVVKALSGSFDKRLLCTKEEFLNCSADFEVMCCPVIAVRCRSL